MFIEKSTYLQSELIPPSYVDDKNVDDSINFDDFRVFEIQSLICLLTFSLVLKIKCFMHSLLCIICIF